MLTQFTDAYMQHMGRCGDYLEWKLLYFDLNNTKICSQRFKEQAASIGLDNGLTQNRQQVIIRTNDGLVSWCIQQGWGQFNSGIGIAAQFQFRNWNCGSIPIPELELELKLVELKMELELKTLELDVKTLELNFFATATAAITS